MIEFKITNWITKSRLDSMPIYVLPVWIVQVEFEYDSKDLTLYLEARADLVPEKHVPEFGLYANIRRDGLRMSDEMVCEYLTRWLAFAVSVHPVPSEFCSGVSGTFEALGVHFLNVIYPGIYSNASFFRSSHIVPLIIS